MLSEIYFQNFGHGDTNLSSHPLILGNSERRGSSARGSLRNPISQRSRADWLLSVLFTLHHNILTFKLNCCYSITIQVIHLTNYNIILIHNLIILEFHHIDDRLLRLLLHPWAPWLRSERILQR